MSNSLSDPTIYGTPVQELWDKYFADPEKDGYVEDLIVRAYLPLVKVVSDKIYASVPNNVEYEEILQNGRIGLMDAIRNWKPEIASFRTYATVKIKSKILDGLRSADWLSRDMRKNVRTVQEGIVELEKELNRTPTDEEVAVRLNMTKAEVQTALLNHSASHVTSLDELLPARNSGDNSAVSVGAHLTDDTELSPHDLVEKKQEADLLREAIETLPERDRQILALYYYENLTLSNIGDILGVTESRICQVRSKALIMLQAKLEQVL